jgi:SAM-dependent methyltransferase
LELGCGTGILWLENLERIPPGLDITLSDLSEGMLQQAEQNLKHSPTAFHFKIIDAQSIPFEDHSFDVIIANHMLYHVPDREKALSEISRVLKPDGAFYASTTGADNMKELTDLVSRFDAGLSAWRKPESISFTLENGPPQLAKVFRTITLSRYPDALLVTDANLLADYLLSGALGLVADRRDELIHFIEQEIKANNGKLQIVKDSGILEAKEPLL